MMVNNKGFTLFEMLIAMLLLMLFLIMVISIPTEAIKSDITTRLFFDRLSVQLSLSQQMAILSQQAKSIKFDASRQMVRFDNIQIDLPEGWYLDQSFIFYYLPSGRTDQFKTVYFRNENGDRIGLAFQLGSGKFEIKFQ